MQLQTILTWTLISIVLLCMVQGTEAHSKEEEYLQSLERLENDFKVEGMDEGDAGNY